MFNKVRLFFSGQWRACRAGRLMTFS
jgi:hypothetical protein